jgi:N-acetyl sugar amidotransferase
MFKTDKKQSGEMSLCALTVLDSSIPGISFDEQGISNYARHAQWRLKNEVFNGDDAKKRLDIWLDRIKSEGRDRDYDCIIGLSGGVDSSYVALKVIELGLRPLAIHLDNGWNSNLAVSNIEKIVKGLGIDLYTYVIDWGEVRDLQRAYIKASLLDLECVSDHAINTTLFRLAKKYRIRHVIHGGNVVTESILPPAWGYDKRDGLNLRSIHRKYGKLALKTYPSMLPTELFYYLFVRKISAFPILNYLDYNKTKAISELGYKFGWVPYQRKHGENQFTRFFQEYYLPKKFGIDKRIITFSAQVLSGELTRESAMAEMAKIPYSKESIDQDINYISKKLDLSRDEFDAIFKNKNANFNDYPSYFNLLKFAKKSMFYFLKILLPNKPLFMYQYDSRNKSKK